MFRRWPVVLAALIAAGSAARADVSPDDAQKAAKLFDQGRKEITAKRIDAACDAFAASLVLDPQLGTRLNLGACRVQQERWNEAYAMFEDALAEAERTGKAPRATFAREQLWALDAKLVTLHLVITSVEGLTASINGEPIDPTKRQRVKPGKFVVDVTAPQRAPFHVEKIADAGADVTIDVPALVPLVDSPVTPTPPTAKGAPVIPRMIERDQPRGPVPYVVAGAGGALLVTAGILTLHARSRWTTATDNRDVDGVTSAQHEADAATVLSIAGVVAVGVGVVLWVRGGKKERVMVTPAGTGVAVSGAF